MGSKYTTQATSGYDSSPPSDDGSATEANKTKWSTVKTKLTDVLKTFAESINTALVEHFDRGPISKSSAYTTTAAEDMKTIEVTGTTTITLGAAATMGAGYTIAIKNVGSNTVTIARSGSDTIDGATSLTLDAQYESYSLQVNVSTDGWHVLAHEDPNFSSPLSYSELSFNNNISKGDLQADSVGASEVVFALTTFTTAYANGTTDLPEGIYIITGPNSTDPVSIEVYNDGASAWVELVDWTSALSAVTVIADGGANKVRVNNATGGSVSLNYLKLDD